MPMIFDQFDTDKAALRRTMDVARKTVSDEKLLDTLKSAWGDPHKFHLAHATELGKLTAGLLGEPVFLTDGTQTKESGAVARLGYREKGWTAIDNSVIADPAVLFGKPPQKASLIEASGDVGLDALRSVRLLPALTLEMEINTLGHIRGCGVFHVLETIF